MRRRSMARAAHLLRICTAVCSAFAALLQRGGTVAAPALQRLCMQFAAHVQRVCSAFAARGYRIVWCLAPLHRHISTIPATLSQRIGSSLRSPRRLYTPPWTPVCMVLSLAAQRQQTPHPPPPDCLIQGCLDHVLQKVIKGGQNSSPGMCATWSKGCQGVVNLTSPRPPPGGGREVVKQWSRSCQEVVRKLSKRYQRVVTTRGPNHILLLETNGQKVVKRLAASGQDQINPKRCQRWSK